MTGTIQKTTPTPPGVDIDFRGLFRTLWAKKWIMVAVSVGFCLIAVVVTLLLPDIYRSEALLAPSEPENNSGIAALASQYAGLASLAGIDLDAGKTDKTILGLEILKSRRFVTEFIENHDLLVPLIAADGWDRSTGDLRIDADDYDVVAGRWIRNVRPPKSIVPSWHEAYEEFSDILFVDQDKTTGFVNIAIEHYSPVVAKQWLTWLIHDLNHTVMKRDVAEAEQAIAFLNEQISNTSLANLQSVFFRLVEEHTKTVMLASVTEEYLFKIVDPPFEPVLKARPKRALIVILSTFLGLLISIAFVLTAEAIRNPDERY